MVQLIVGEKGKGKTKYLLESVDKSVKEANGNLVYIDKNEKHMLELSNKIRFINAKDYPIASCQEFIGFLCGVISQDHDLETIFLDSFSTVAQLPSDGIEPAIIRLDEVSQVFNVDFVVSLTAKPSELPESTKKYVSISL